MPGIDEAARLDRHFDALLFGEPAPLARIDSHLSEMLAELRALSAAPPPSPFFVARLEDQILTAATSAPPGLAVMPAAMGDARARDRVELPSPLPRPSRIARPHAWVATAALLMLTFAASFAILRYGSLPPDHDLAPLSAVQSDPRTPTCAVPPRLRVPAPPRTGTATNILPASDAGEPGVLDRGIVTALRRDAQPAHPETVRALNALVRELALCQQQRDPDPMRIFALFSDVYLFFALDMPAMTPPQDITGEPLRDRLAALPQIAFGPGEPTVEDAVVLFTGDVGAVVRTSSGDAYYVVFVQTVGGWLIDEVARYPFPAETATAMATPPAEATVPLELAAVTMFDILYVPQEVTIPADTEATLALTNAGQVEHTFVADALGIDVRLKPGETRTIAFTASPGVYDYVCVMPGHRAAGMAGALTAVSSNAATSAAPTP